MVMKTYKDAIEYVNNAELNKNSFVKIGNTSNKLIVSFASNSHSGYERKNSLMSLKYAKDNFDVLYLRNKRGWYLGGLEGIGVDINQTINFLKMEFSKYKNILCIGNSAGGFASLLFGSLLKVDMVITHSAQIDLEYVINRVKYLDKLKEFSLNHGQQWNLYKNISKFLCEEVSYYFFSDGDSYWEKTDPYTGKILHGEYHYNQIKNFPTLSKIEKYEIDYYVKLFIGNKDLKLLRTNPT